MFSKGPRFDPPRSREVSGPNAHYVLQVGSQTDAYKRGVILEKTSRFPTEASLQSGDDEEKMEHHMQLEQAPTFVNEYDERLANQKQTCDTFAAGVQELTKSSVADQAQMKDLRMKLRLSERERTNIQVKHDGSGDVKKSIRRDETRDKDKRIAELETSLDQEARKREAVERRLKEVQVEANTVRQELDLSREDRRKLQTILSSQLDEVQSREKTLTAQLEQHRAMLQRVAEEYGRLARSTVEKCLFARVKRDYDTQHMETLRITRRLANSEDQVTELASLVRSAKTENQFLVSQLHDAHEMISYYRSALYETLATNITCEAGSTEFSQLVAEVNGEVADNQRYITSTELNDAERYQEAYHSLLEEVGGLIARNALAEDEAEHLRKFNAEILGHSNPAQRIMYVDRVRRELAETRQRLLQAIREHNAVTSENTALLEELSMYKSVMTRDRRPRTNLTRILRPPLAQTSVGTVQQGGPTNHR